MTVNTFLLSIAILSFSCGAWAMFVRDWFNNRKDVLPSEPCKVPMPKVKQTLPGHESNEVLADWLSHYAICIVQDIRSGRRLLEIAARLRSK